MGKLSLGQTPGWTHRRTAHPGADPLALAWIGGWIGALVAVYGHRRRHKTRKLRFLIPLWLAALTWLVVLALVARRLVLP